MQASSSNSVKKGLARGEIVQSWASTGLNEPVAPQQFGHSIDPDMLQQLASKVGSSLDILTTHLAEILPKIVDRLTSDG